MGSKQNGGRKGGRKGGVEGSIEKSIDGTQGERAIRGEEPHLLETAKYRHIVLDYAVWQFFSLTVQKQMELGAFIALACPERNGRNALGGNDGSFGAFASAESGAESGLGANEELAVLNSHMQQIFAHIGSSSELVAKAILNSLHFIGNGALADAVERLPNADIKTINRHLPLAFYFPCWPGIDLYPTNTEGALLGKGISLDGGTPQGREIANCRGIGELMRYAGEALASLGSQEALKPGLEACFCAVGIVDMHHCFYHYTGSALAGNQAALLLLASMLLERVEGISMHKREGLPNNCDESAAPSGAYKGKEAGAGKEGGGGSYIREISTMDALRVALVLVSQKQGVALGAEEGGAEEGGAEEGGAEEGGAEEGAACPLGTEAILELEALGLGEGAINELRELPQELLGPCIAKKLKIDAQHYLERLCFLYNESLQSSSANTLATGDTVDDGATESEIGQAYEQLAQTLDLLLGDAPKASVRDPFADTMPALHGGLSFGEMWELSIVEGSGISGDYYDAIRDVARSILKIEMEGKAIATMGAEDRKAEYAVYSHILRQVIKCGNVYLINEAEHFAYHCSASLCYYTRGMLLERLGSHDIALSDYLRALSFDAKCPINDIIKSGVERCRLVLNGN